MAKRFTIIEKWQDKWFSNLPIKFKILWLYILDTCDHAGIWESNLKLAGYFIGENYEEEDALSHLGQKIKVLSDSKWFVKKFIHHQYNCSIEGLNPENNAHIGVLKKLSQYNIEGASKGLASGSIATKDKDKDKVKDKDKDNKSLATELPKIDKPLSDVQKVVTVFKLVSGYPKEDKSWDKMHFARYSKSAKSLIEFLGDWKSAGNCVQDIYEQLSAKGLTVTLETICKHSADWKKNKQEKEGDHGILSLPSPGIV